MVELKGTEKQIAWAEDIRKEVFGVINLFEKAEEYLDCKDETKAKIMKKLAAVKETLQNESNSKFFINTFSNLTYIQKDMEKTNKKYETLEKNDKNLDYYNSANSYLIIEKVDFFHGAVQETDLKLSGRLVNAVKAMYDRL